MAASNPLSKTRSRLWIIVASVLGVLLLTGAGFALARVLTPSKNDSNAVAKLWVLDKYVDQGEFAWTENIIASSAASDLAATFECPAESAHVFTFLSEPGAERLGPLRWVAYSESAFLPGTTQVLEPNLKPSGLTAGIPGARATHAQAGNFSLGVACTGSAEDQVLWAAYRSVSFDSDGPIRIAAEPNLQEK